jgi:hypothetical protein
VQVSHPPIERQFKKRQIDRYAVVMDTDGPSGNVHYEYELTFTAIQPIMDSTDTKVTAMFTNLKETLDDREAPTKRTFGTASYRFPVSGFPMDFSLGEGSPFMIPILSLYTPRYPVGATGSFEASGLEFDDSISVAGTGTYDSKDHKIGSVHLALTFSSPVSAKGFCQDGCTFESTAEFSLKNGVLLSAKGTENRKDGVSLKFKVRKL